MKNLKEILREELDYWKDVAEYTNNKLLKRIAYSNITKRRKQLNKLSRGIKV